jgi:hypothetical protein
MHPFSAPPPTPCLPGYLSSCMDGDIRPSSPRPTSFSFLRAGDFFVCDFQSASHLNREAVLSILDGRQIISISPNHPTFPPRHTAVVIDFCTCQEGVRFCPKNLEKVGCRGDSRRGCKGHVDFAVSHLQAAFAIAPPEWIGLSICEYLKKARACTSGVPIVSPNRCISR